MAVHKWLDLMERKYGKEGYDRLREEVTAEIAAEIERDVRAILELAGKSEQDVPDTVFTLEDFSTPERRVLAIRRYVVALGGDLEVVARFGDKSVRLRGV